MTLYDTKSGVNIHLQSLQKVDTFRLKIVNQTKRTKRTEKPQKRRPFLFGVTGGYGLTRKYNFNLTQGLKCKI